MRPKTWKISAKSTLTTVCAIFLCISSYAQTTWSDYAAARNTIWEEKLERQIGFLAFNVEEITQRFVRGDESRTAEGNGLGLAIAKSYTEICNGTFDIVVDGDMFKAILKFKKYS